MMTVSLATLLPWAAFADVPSNQGARPLTDADRMFLARQLLAKVKPVLEATDKQIKEDRGEFDLSNIPEGEELFFRIRLTNQIWLDYQLLARAEGGKLVLSLKDFVDAVQFPIKFDEKAQTANGWYIRQSKAFNLDFKKHEVVTDHGTFELSDAVKAEDGDIYVPSVELEKWFGFDLKPNVSQLEFRLVSDMKLPIQEKMERHERLFTDTGMEPPRLPPVKSEQKMIDYPFVDLFSETRHTRPGTGAKSSTQSYANVRTSGDFAHGTLTTQSQFQRDQNLTNARVTYKKESLEPELLGPLKARRYELGDITPVQVPVTSRFTTGVGARVTNKDYLRTVTGAYTDITGNAIPGWDVELYRGDQLLGIQTVGDDGRYTFPKVDLYGSDNTFRVVTYGLQGEVDEQEIYIPVDPKRLADSGSAYDISIVGQDTTTYDKLKIKGKDDGAPSLTALYEVPVGKSSAVTAGLTTRQDDGDQKATGIAGLSTTFAGALWNFNTAVDSKGEMAGEIITRKDIGKHQIRNETRVATEKFDYEKPDENNNLIVTNLGPSFDREAFGNELSINGPLDLNLGMKPHYNVAMNYSESSEGLSAITGVAGFSTSLRPLSFNQQLLYTSSDSAEEDTLDALTNLAGTIGKNRIRLTSDYQIMPDSQLKRVGASVNRYISKDMDIEGGVQHFMQDRFTEVSAKLNWDSGYGNISPSISYNTDKDVIAAVTTRFGLTRDPLSGSPKMFDRQITTNGGLSVFVFLDKNGDNIFNDGDEPVPDAVIKAPQNGGREVTDEKGYALFSHMAQLLLTDVYIDPSSLADPYWIPAYEGGSVLPREGHMITMEFPVHMSGEIDGTLYARGRDGGSTPVRSVSLGLYDKTGKQVQETKTEQDGYYLFSKIPPGTYYLVVDDQDVTKDASRPLPQIVRIGYEGTTIYANNIYMKQGTMDVPLTILAGNLPYDAATLKPYEGRNFALNLGGYKSRLAMALAWFKIRTFNHAQLADMDLIEKPSESYPAADAQSYVLRASLKQNDLNGAYKACGEILRNGNYCSVEIVSGGLAQAIPDKDEKISSR